MICKWCGEPVKTGSRTCRRCKQEIPALSDCGGFYNLVADAAPVSPGIPETPPVAETPIRPMIPERKKSSSLSGLICGVAVALAAVLLIMTISLSGKLADAREEADRLRNQLKNQPDTSTTDPTAPIINGFGQKDPESTAEPDEISLNLRDGAWEIELTDAQNALLNEGILHFNLFRDGEADALLTFTLQRRSAGEGNEELYLQILHAQGISIRSVQWHLNSLVELPTEEDDGFGFGHFFTSSDDITEYSQPVAELGEGANVCVLTGEDENGKELTIAIQNIVID